MRKTRSIPAWALLGALTAFSTGPVLADHDDGPSFQPNSGPNAPYYRIRYLSDRDNGDGDLIEHGVFDTQSQATEIIDMLAHLTIAYRVDCTCEEYRRDVFGSHELEEDILERLPQYGYIPRLVAAPQVALLPEGYPVTTPFLRLSGDGYYGWW